MIELYEGVPGSGKSYHGIAEKFLPWVRQGRRLYIYVDGIYLDRLALFGLIEMLVFLAILVVGYAYAWRKGALEWQ